MSTLTLRLALVAIGCALAPDAMAQAPSRAEVPAPDPAGAWRGTSRCLVHPSACRDEVVVYRIARLGAADSLSVDARKIVRGEEEAMGVLGCHLAAARGELTCPIPHGTWRFTVLGDSLVGELRLTDGTRFRDVRAARSRGP